VVVSALAVSLAGRDYLRASDLDVSAIDGVLELAAELKLDRYEPRLPGRTLGLLFKKPSTRTRVSFAVAIAQLGGTAVPLHAEEMQLSRGESLGDTARVLSSYLDAIAIRTFEQSELAEWAAAASIPVVNALTDEEHPCQALADALTIRERFGETEGLRVAWLGDGTNVCNSLAVTAEALGMQMIAACPAGYDPLAGSVVRDPRVAVEGANVLVTDTWTSMGQEDEAEARLRDLEPYRLSEELLELADPDAIVLHCLPAHAGEEIDASVLYGPQSAVWQEAENRLHVQKALLTLLLG
jgi:ornithine carbamoyltransferase